ncbi:MAG: (Fe-S)-binding protein [Pseudomonadota bacterium]
MMDHADILHRCFRCGYCKMPGDYADINCPSYLCFRFESFSPGGRLWLLRALLDGEIKAGPRLGEIMYSCAACGNCVEHCVFPKFKDDILKALVAGREELVERGAVPPPVRDYFKAMHVNGNPYKLPRADRAAWAAGLDLEPYQGQEYLFYVGDAGALDERGVKMARATALLFKKLNLSLGILGAGEAGDGAEVRAMGERGLFELLARENIERFKSLGVKKVVALSPHAYHVFKNEYPALGGDFQVFHYTQVLAPLVRQAMPVGRAERIKTVFHDPCQLGRLNGEYQAPRTILRSLPGLQVLEMDRSRKNALCCGGGGGNFFTDILGNGAARARVREAAGTGAEILAVACPKCLKMLEDAVKTEELEPRIRVLDLSELVLSQL